MSILLSLTASNVKGNTKRAIVNAMFFIGYCAGCIGAPQLWTEPPRYFAGVVTAIVTWCLLFVVTLAYRWVCIADNRKRESEAAIPGDSDVGAGGKSGHVEVFLDKYGAPKSDLTDKDDRDFRYSW